MTLEIQDSRWQPSHARFAGVRTKAQGKWGKSGASALLHHGVPFQLCWSDLEQFQSIRRVRSWLRLRVALSACIGVSLGIRLLRPPRHTCLADAPNAPPELQPL